MNSDNLKDWRIFLCHAKEDKPAVRELYLRLRSVGFAPWLDHEDLVPGEEWEHAIREALRASIVVVVCLSPSAVSKTGFFQREIKFALDRAEEMPENTIYVIPAMLVQCGIPSRLSRYQCADLTRQSGFDRLTNAIDKASSRRIGVLPIVLLVHRAFFVATKEECYFVNATNVSNHEVELTHLWFATSPEIDVSQASRPLPKRLQPNETWETWLSIRNMPEREDDAVCRLARARLSDGTVVGSLRNETVPNRGVIPGGPVQFQFPQESALSLSVGTPLGGIRTGPNSDWNMHSLLLSNVQTTFNLPVTNISASVALSHRRALSITISPAIFSRSNGATRQFSSQPAKLEMGETIEIVLAPPNGACVQAVSAIPLQGEATNRLAAGDWNANVVIKALSAEGPHQLERDYVIQVRGGAATILALEPFG